MPPEELTFMHPTTPERLKERSQALAKEQEREALGQAIQLPCGCRVRMFNHHGIEVKYCQRHNTFTFSPRHDGTDVFYFTTEDKRP